MDLGGITRPTAGIDLHRLFLHFGAPSNTPIKLYRHTRAKIDSVAYEHHDLFQSVQTSRQLGLGLVAFFVGEEGRMSRFTGMRRVLSACRYGEATGPRFELAKQEGFIERQDLWWHEIEVVPGFESLENRLTVLWPPEGRHHQWLLEKPNGQPKSIAVHEIRPHGFSGVFPGFNQIRLSYDELRQLFRNGDAGWKSALASTRGVYLITDIATGDLYVGSATGSRSFWGRWEDYTKSGHGGNVIMKERLKQAISEGRTFLDGLQFSILETLSNVATADDGRAAERNWKLKLGNRATALNDN